MLLTLFFPEIKTQLTKCIERNAAHSKKITKNEDYEKKKKAVKLDQRDIALLTNTL